MSKTFERRLEALERKFNSSPRETAPQRTGESDNEYFQRRLGRELDIEELIMQTVLAKDIADWERYKEERIKRGRFARRLTLEELVAPSRAQDE